MAAIGQSYVGLIDAFKRSDDPEKLTAAAIIELLRETNGIYDDAMTVTCNQGMSHKTTVRTGLPSVAWGKLYSGIAQSKSRTQQVVDTTGFVEGISAVDTRLLDLHSSPDALRMSEATAFLESMSQEVASTFFYGDATADPEKFTGLAPRFSSTTADNGGQIVLGGGAGSDNTSIWMVSWSDQACHMIHPENTAAGIQREDKGVQRVLDGSSNPYYVEEELFRQHAGVTVRDWRQVARVANIDVSDLAAGSVDIYSLMRKAFWKLAKHRLPNGRICIYCNSDVLEALDADSTPTTGTSASFVRLRPQEVDGFEVMSYRGFPVRQVDAILNTESLVS